MKETWKDINNVRTIYQISNTGKVKTSHHRYKTERILKPGLAGNGYLTVSLLTNDGLKRTHYLHRLIAEYFIPNPLNKKCINHKDGNKQNNLIENLEWVSHGENNSHAIMTGLKKSIWPARGIIQLDLQGNEVARYRTSEDVPGISSGSVCKCCNNPNYTAKGFKFKFIN